MRLHICDGITDFFAVDTKEKETKKIMEVE